MDTTLHRATRPSGRRRLSMALAHRAAKPLLFVLCCLPFAWLFWRAATNGLGANPAEALVRASGDWTLRLLLLTLAVTPLRQATGLPALAGFRRMLGLFTAFYALCHFSAYAWLDMGLDVAQIGRDIPKRPFILVGTAAGLLMLALAATSFNAAVRWLGPARWQALHRAVYAIGVLAILHFWWMRMGKNLWGEVAVHGAILAALLGWRLWWRQARARR